MYLFDGTYIVVYIGLQTVFRHDILWAFHLEIRI